MREQLSQVSTAAADAGAQNSKLQADLAGSQSEVAELMQQLSESTQHKQHTPIQVRQIRLSLFWCMLGSDMLQLEVQV